MENYFFKNPDDYIESIRVISERNTEDLSEFTINIETRIFQSRIISAFRKLGLPSLDERVPFRDFYLIYNAENEFRQNEYLTKILEQLETRLKPYRIRTKNIIVKKTEVVESFKDGPPCLNTLAQDGFGEGSRNNALFNVAVYHKQANPDTWEDKVMEDNSKWMNPPLGFQEVKQLLASIGKRGYDKYRCKDQPICGVCNAAKCRTKKFGVGFEEEQMPELDTLTKINSNPPQWFLNVAGKRIELKTEQLHNPNLFAIAVLDQANVVSPIPKAKDWREVYLTPLMLNLQEIDPLESLNPTNQIENLLYDFTVHRAKARTKDDILNKTAWTDEGFSYFRMEDFYTFAKRNNWELDKTKTYNLITQLENIFVAEIRMELKNQTPRIVKINSMKDNGAEVSQVPYQESPF